MQAFNKIFTKQETYVPFVAIVLGLLVGAIVMWLGGYNPWEAYGAMLNKIFGSKYDFGEAIRQVTPLIFTGLAVAFAFRAGLFNIGAEGQFITGMTAATWIGINLDLPWFIHMPLAVIVGGIAGALWAGIAGWLKASRGVNEVISTIMLNWIAYYLANYMVRVVMVEPGQNRSKDVQETASASMDWLVSILDNARVHWGTLVAVLCAFVFYYILWRTRQGYELRASGFNPDAAHYAGINVKGSIVKAMMISGALAGLGGAFESLGVFKSMAVMNALPGYGFDGIAVSLLGGNNPFGIIFGGLLFGFLSYGSTGMSFEADVPNEIIRIVIGAVIFFVASHGIVKWFLKPFFRKRREERKEAA
ncbi:Unspecified monosaccharide ABC transport system, permease component Ia [Paenibacillus pasadenensis]|uniref:Unspecified monosaccharide ABC transport system, permease component Ia n=1 Tax=Paenibacillus pasadenensis TaxID=217090 RepID=A0A2N5MZT0_9BACL|nr:ABC transporter permease [Paenibacillus pasadenensis]PLT43590.1 Unspecified monosaccharide ABC transport system, permease component Ia [Paenibacillus pasadenensis]